MLTSRAHRSRDFSLFDSCRARGSDRVSNRAPSEECGAAHASPYLAASDQLPTWPGVFFLGGLFTLRKTRPSRPVWLFQLSSRALCGGLPQLEMQCSEERHHGRVARCKFVLSTLLAITALVAVTAFAPGAARPQDTWLPTPTSGDFNTAINWNPSRGAKRHRVLRPVRHHRADILGRHHDRRLDIQSWGLRLYVH